MMRRALEALDAADAAAPAADGSGASEAGPSGAAGSMAGGAEPPGPIVAVGVRALTTEERDLLRARRLETVFAHEMREEGWLDRALGALGPDVYITLDVDFFDPALLPATGTPEPGGGTWWQAVDLLEAVFRERNVLGVDVVELAPREEHAASAFVVARLVYRILGLHARARGLL